MHFERDSRWAQIVRNRQRPISPMDVAVRTPY
jgi:hypothetical protein